MEKFCEILAPAAEYLEGIDTNTWAEAYMTVSRVGHDPSKVVKSVNRLLKLNREHDFFYLGPFHARCHAEHELNVENEYTRCRFLCYILAHARVSCQ